MWLKIKNDHESFIALIRNSKQFKSNARLMHQKRVRYAFVYYKYSSGSVYIKYKISYDCAPLHLEYGGTLVSNITDSRDMFFANHRISMRASLY